MRRRGGLVRVVTVCARCGARPDVYPFRIERGLVGHELAVCRDCNARPAGEATFLERAALGVDPGDSLDVMAFVESHVADPGRLQRTARYFLGDERVDELTPACRQVRAEARGRDAAWPERYVPTLDDGDDDEDAFRWGDDDDDE